MQVATRGVEKRHSRRISWRLRIFIGVLFLLEAVAYGIPTVGKLERELGQIDLPKGTRIAESEVSGNVICFDECTSLDQRYLMPGTVDDEDVAEILRASRYEAFIAESDDYRGNRAYSRRFEIRWWVGKSDGGVTSLELGIKYT